MTAFLFAKGLVLCSVRSSKTSLDAGNFPKALQRSRSMSWLHRERTVFDKNAISILVVAGDDPAGSEDGEDSRDGVGTVD